MLWLVGARPAAAQFQTGFEPPDSYIGFDVGTVLTAQNGWYLPASDTSFGDFSVFTYDGNALGMPANPAGATQFIGGQALGDGTFPAAQMDFDWGTQTQWTVEYDFAAHFRYRGRDTRSGMERGLRGCTGFHLPLTRSAKNFRPKNRDSFPFWLHYISDGATAGSKVLRQAE